VTRLRLILVLLPFLAGCMQTGRVFTHVVEPYTENFDRTPVGTKSCIVDNYKVEEPFSGYDLSAEWDMDVVARAAREAGMTRIYTADRETLEIWFGTFRRRRLIVYGE
jgi:hypothetical protein